MKKSQNVISKCFSLGFLSKIFLVFTLLFINVDVLALDDVTPPVISNVALSQTELTAGNVVSITADFSDETPDGSTIYAQFTYVDGSWGAVGIPMYLDLTTGQLTANLGFNEYMWNGVYAFTMITATDGAGNSIEYPLEGLTFTVSGAVDRDTTAPILSNVTLSQTEVQPGDVIYVSADIEDASLYMNVFSYLYYSYVDGSNSNQVALYFNNENGKLEGTINITEETPNGTWKLNSLSASDAQGNWAEVNLIDLTYIVSGGLEQDLTPPVISNISIVDSQVSLGEDLIITADITDETPIGSFVQLRFKHQDYDDTNNINLYYNQATGKLEGSISIISVIRSGTWNLYEIYAYDGLTNSVTMEASGVSFYVENGYINDTNAPIILGVSLSQSELSPGDVLTITTNISDETLDGSYGYLYLNYDNTYYVKQVYFYYNSLSGKLEGSIEITNSMWNGLWHLNYMNVWDGAGNPTFLESVGQSILISGSNDPDVVAPVVSNITLSQTNVQPGDTINLTADIDDLSKQGSWAQLEFKYQGNFNEYSWISLSYNVETDKLEGSFAVPDTMYNGVWNINRVVTGDGASNYGNFEYSNISITVSGGKDYDYVPPMLSNLTLSKTDLIPGDVLLVTVDIDDESLEGAYGYLYYTYNNNFNNLSIFMNYNSSSGKLEGTLEITDLTMNGKWNLMYLNAFDNKGNTSTLGLSGTSFDVSGGVDPDLIPPVVSNFTISQNEAQPGDVINLSADIEDQSILNSRGQVALKLRGSNYLQWIFMNYNQVSGKLEGSIYVDYSLSNGIWDFEYFYGVDGAGNYSSLEIDDLNITITGSSEPDLSSPEISEITLSNNEFNVGDELTITAKVNDANLNTIFGTVFISSQDGRDGRVIVMQYNSETNILSGSIIVDEFMSRGTWNIESFQATDYYQNETNLTSLDFSFMVNTSVDPETVRPDFVLSKNLVKYGDRLNITVDISNRDYLKDTYGNAELYMPLTGEMYYVSLMYDSSIESLVASFDIPDYFIDGEWFISRIALYDGTNHQFYYDSNNSFVVDNTPPVVEGVENGALYNTDKLISFNEGSATLNDNDFVSGDLATFEGENTLVVTDLLGHQTVVNFRIDKTAPIVEGLESDTYVLSTPVITFTEGTALLNGQEFISGNTVSTFGAHSLVLTDEAGNATTKNFVVTLPRVLGLVSSTLSYKSVELLWNSVDYANGYEVYRNYINTGAYELIIDTNGLEFVDVNLLNDQVYDYKVRAYVLVNGTKYFGEYSEVSSSRTSLLTPQNTQASSVSTTSISLTWDNVLDADSYEVYSSTSEFGTYNLIGSSSSTSLLNTRLSGGTTYFYKVRATSTVNGVKIYGEFTSPFSAIPVPSQVMGLSAAPSSSSTIKLTWNMVSGVKGYEVYRLNSSTNEYELIADITGTSFTDSKRIVNTLYYYKVKAYITVKKDKFYGDFSDIVSASTVRK